MPVAIFAGGGGWAGSSAQIGVRGLTGSMTLLWVGDTAQVGVRALSTLFWQGDTAVVGVRVAGGAFAGEPRRLGRTGVAVLGRSRVEVIAGQSRTAMMVGTGQPRTGER